MKLDPVLTKASRLIRSGKYEAAVRLLQPEVTRYHGSFNYYYLLGAACLYSGDTGGALTYFRLAHEADGKDPLAILGLAVLYLRRNETARALDFYLNVLEINPGNRIAKKAMKLIRKHAGTEAFSSLLLETGKISSLYPPVPFAGFFRKEIFAALAVFAAACIAAYGVLVFLRFFPNPFNPRGTRQGTREFSLTREERMASVESGGSYSYELTRPQAVELYEKAVSLFNARRDDAARVNLNKILESNAADVLKNRAGILISFLETPGFDTFHKSDNTVFAEVKKDPLLYNGVHVIWRGRAANIKIIDTMTELDLLVGYDNRETFEGYVQVVFNSAVSINPERPVEILGKIIPVNNDEGLYLEGVSFHQTNLPD